MSEKTKSEKTAYSEVPQQQTLTMKLSNIPATPQKETIESEDADDRGNWSNHLDFLLSCIGYAVGLGNVWRFPYLCYSNGGGAFLIPYLVMLCLAGVPLFFLELAFGQYCSKGPIRAWNAVPLMRGVGYGMVVVSAIVGIYYNVIITYSLFYFFKSFARVLPWEGCHHSWNTPYCSQLVQECIESGGIVNENNTCVAIGNLTVAEQESYNITYSDDGNLTGYSDPLHASRQSASAEFYKYGMLNESGDISEPGMISWQLTLCLLFAWALMFLCLVKGVKSSGKVVYFTATFPYVVLFILFIRGITLEGQIDGIKFFITPKWELLKNAKVWKDAAVQIFYSLSASWGGLITLSSYNKFKNNCFRDAMIVPIANCATSVFAGFVIFSILGHMAHVLNKPVGSVVDEQFGLAFIAYPEAVTLLPISPLWAILFFFMLITLGMDSQFCIIETVTTAILDEFPSLRKRKHLIVFLYCFIGFIFGLSCVTQAGGYWVILMDKYAADFALLIFGLCECIGIGWIYGARRFMNDIRTMLGDKIVDHPLFNFWPLTWCCITPGVLLFVLGFNWATWTFPTAGEYEYPAWAHVIGWLMICSSLICIPAVWAIEFVRADGGFVDRIKYMVTPRPEWGPLHLADRREAIEIHRQNGTTMGGVLDPSLPEKNEKDLEGGVAIPLHQNGVVPMQTIDVNALHLNGAVGGPGSTV
ncbi:sodium- and chloride-dependent glycine transporter 1-like [Lytechinus variegatus]|uniref:sodium- and chloride-dependent glycine transporter 1-like n=1 Tax=Lytechinus variegatus TaxID=7654 RepID=UPI001BB2B069|nr:sodium- and chloride-dependent glycine transporter 1-like [Lytechinus variegatus]